MKRTSLITVGSIFFLAVTAGAAEITNWNDDNPDHWQGWTYTPNGGGDWNWAVKSGDDGYVYFNDTSGPIGGPFLMAPSRYHGDYRSYGPDVRFEMDVRVVAFTSASVGPTLLLTGPGGSASYVLDTPNTTWQQFVAQIDGVGWNVASGTWSGLIADVTGVGIAGDIVDGLTAEAGFDNFTLIPEPASMMLILFGASAVLLRRRKNR